MKEMPMAGKWLYLKRKNEKKRIFLIATAIIKLNSKEGGGGP